MGYPLGLSTFIIWQGLIKITEDVASGKSTSFAKLHLRGIDISKIIGVEIA
jgi:hypothetical protein